MGAFRIAINRLTAHPSFHQTKRGLVNVKMPAVGLGTWRTKSEEIQKTILLSLDIGYRHFDTAFNYNNEQDIGKAVKTWVDSGKGKREDLFITTKLPNIGNRAEDVEKFLEMSLQRLDLDYIDLYLIHMPFSFRYCPKTFRPLTNEDGTFDLDLTNDNIATWKVMEEQVKKGLVKTIGLSNFNAEQVRKIYDSAEIKPAVLQVEMHAYLQQSDLLEICKELNITLTAFAPLGSPGSDAHFLNKYDYKVKNFPNLLGLSTVKAIGEKHKKSNAQILLRHLVQKGAAIIPKSTSESRLKENINIFDFELDQQDIDELNKLDKKEDGRIINFAFFKGVEKHPEYPFKTPSTK